MAKLKKLIWVQFLFLIPYILIRTILLQTMGWQFITIYLIGILSASSLILWVFLTYVESFKNLNIIFSILLLIIIIRIIIEHSFVVLYIYCISIVLSIPIWIFANKQENTLPFFPLVFYFCILLFILSWGWL